MKYLAIYDIADVKRLNRIARIMKDYGFRVQKSKFEIEVSPFLFAILQERVFSEMEPEEAGVKSIPLCSGCFARTEVIGLGHYVDFDEEVVVL
jgi:CRISPR-associated protein Cas2